MEPKRLLNKEVSFLDVLSLFLSVYVLMQLLVEVLFSLSAETKIILGYADYFVSAVFLLDFLVRFKAAPSKLSFMKLGWIDLLSAVPVNNWLMLGRFTRVVRLVRVIRALRSTEKLLRILLRHRLQNTLLVLTTISVLLVVTCGSAMLTLEKDQKDANIATVGDALWWATTTITTVGYGDKYPTTGEGRVLAVVLMVAGVGLFSTVSGTIAAILINPKLEESESETAQILRELRTLRAELALVRSQGPGEEGQRTPQSGIVPE